MICLNFQLLPIHSAYWILQTTTHLYKMLQAGGRPSWVLISEDAQPNIYDSNQDSQRRPEWHLELEGCQEAPDIVIDDTLEFQQPQRRCVFLGDGTVWALAFPNDRSFSNFMQKYNRALFENNYGLEQNEDNELNVCDRFDDTVFTGFSVSVLFQSAANSLFPILYAGFWNGFHVVSSS